MDNATKQGLTFVASQHKGELTKVESEVVKILAEVVDSSTSAELRAAVQTLKIVKVKEIDVDPSKKALVLVVPYTTFKQQVKPLHQRIIAELEKKSKRHVILIAQRSVMKKNTKRPGLRIRPRSRTLTSVQDAILEDVVGPTEIVGRRLTVKTDGTQTHKILLDPKDKTKDNLEEKLATFTAVYQALTSKRAVFDFPEYTL